MLLDSRRSLAAADRTWAKIQNLKSIGITPGPNLKFSSIKETAEINDIPLTQKDLPPMQKPTPHLHTRFAPPTSQP